MKEIRAEVITIGDEILYGQITDTNTQWLSAELSLLGIKTVRKTSIGDRYDAIFNILQEASQRAELVILTGGLGPTNDDITKNVLCDFSKQDLIENGDVLGDVRQYFARLGKELSEVNKKQALVPRSSKVLRNHKGTAPGMWLEVNDTVFISLPGVPFEMKGIMSDYGLKAIKEHFQTPYIVHQMIRTAGIGESVLAEQIKDWEAALPSFLSLAYLPSYGQVRLRITGMHENKTLLEQEILKQTQLLLPLIDKKYFYALGDVSLEEHIGNLLSKQKETLAIAESCTGGYVQHLITSVPGSSAYFKGGIVSYSNEIKINELAVSEALLAQKGAVSLEVVEMMATGILMKYNTTYAVAISGIAGPDGGTEEKPVGFVCMAFASSKGELFSKTFQFLRDRDTNIKASANALLNLLRLGVEGKLS
jgi:nicotinamide-nucleotide amidase